MYFLCEKQADVCMCECFSLSLKMFLAHYSITCLNGMPNIEIGMKQGWSSLEL